MKKRTLFRCTAVLSTMILFACASGKNHYNTAMQLHSAGKYTEAINYLKSAIDIEPKNSEYRQALGDIKESLISRYVTEARDALSGDSEITISAINKARASYEKAKEIDPNHNAVIDVKAQIDRRDTELLNDVKTLYRQTKTFIDGNEWIKAYFNLQQIQSRFPNYEDTFHLTSLTKDKGSDYYFKKAEDLFNQERFKECMTELRNALNLKPDHMESRKLMEQAKANDNMDYFVERAREAIKEKDWDKSVKAYERALEYTPGDSDLESAVALAKDHSRKAYIVRARRNLEQGYLLRAVNDFFTAKEYLKDPNDYQIKSLRANLTSRISDVAEMFKERDAYGGAWYWYKKLKQVDPDHPEIFELTLAMEDRISQRVKKSIAVFDFESPSDTPDAGKIFANNLSNYLFNNASGDIKIMEREKLKSIVDEMKLGQTGMITEHTKRMGDLYGIDVAIMGSVLKYHVEKSVSQSTKSVKYQVGTKIEDNIEFLNWKARNPDPSQKELAEAPPAKVTIPEFVSKSYNVANHKKVGFVELSFRIVDVSTGENIQVKTIERKLVAEDETSAGLEEANIAFDPLEIDTDTELLNKMTDEVVAELGREVLKPLQALEKQYYEAGEALLKRRNELEAIEKFVDAIMDEKLKMIQGSPINKKSIQNIDSVLINYTTDI